MISRYFSMTVISKNIRNPLHSTRWEWKKCHDVVEVKTHSLGATTLLYSGIHVRVLMGTWCVWWGCGSVMWLAHSVASGTWELLLPTPWVAATKALSNPVHCNQAQTEKKHLMPQQGHRHTANPHKKWHPGIFYCLWSRCHLTNFKHKHKAVSAWQPAKRYHRGILETEWAIISLLAAIMVEKGLWTPCDLRMCFKKV